MQEGAHRGKRALAHRNCDVSLVSPHPPTPQPLSFYHSLTVCHHGNDLLLGFSSFIYYNFLITVNWEESVLFFFFLHFPLQRTALYSMCSKCIWLNSIELLPAYSRIKIQYLCAHAHGHTHENETKCRTAITSEVKKGVWVNRGSHSKILVMF